MADDTMATTTPASALDRAGATIVVTGAGGFVGRHLLAALRTRFPAATILSAGRGAGAAIGFDLDDPTTAANVAAARPDAVVHLAGEASIADPRQSAARTWRGNLGGTLALAHALAALDAPPTLLFTSSAEVYGRAFLGGEPVTEDVVPQPLTLYGRCKLATERMLDDVLDPRSTLIVARPSNHVGPGQNSRFALPSFARQIVAGEREGRTARIQVGSLDSARDFFDVRDVARAYAGLLGALHGSGRRETFNIASGTSRPVRALLDMLIAQAEVPCEVIIDTARVRASEIPVAAVSPAAVAHEIGWRATLPLEQAARDVLDEARADAGLARPAGIAGAARSA